MPRKGCCSSKGSLVWDRRGIALVAVLWVLVLLSVIAAGFLYETRTQTKLARNLVENAKARALADAGVHRAVLALLEPRTKGLLGPEIENLLLLAPDPRAPRRRLEGALERELAGVRGAETEGVSRQGWRADGTVYAWAFGGAEVRISIEDEGGKIDLNRARDELLKGLFVWRSGGDECAPQRPRLGESGRMGRARANRLGIVLRHAPTLHVHEAEVFLGWGEALLGGPFDPPHRLGIVLRHAPAVGIDGTKASLGQDIALLGGLAKPIRSFAIVLGDAYPLRIHGTKGTLSCGIAPIGSHAIPIHRSSTLALLVERAAILVLEPGMIRKAL